jgi:hypothetical protein
VIGLLIPGWVAYIRQERFCQVGSSMVCDGKHGVVSGNITLTEEAA